MLSKFLNLGFYRSTVLFITKKYNLSGTFYQVQALRRWGGRHNHSQTRNCFFDRFAKNYSVHLRFDNDIPTRS